MNNDVLNYYDSMPEKEWNRTKECRYSNIEFDIVMFYLKKYIPNFSTVLEFGSGPGAYSISLAEYGCQVGLVDISSNSLALAKKKFKEKKLENQIIETVCTSIIDYTREIENKYSSSLLFGPLYHITNREERVKCLEIAKHNTIKNGYIFGIFISRYAILKDLVKTGDFDIIDELLNTKFLEHGIYDPSQLKSNKSLKYMPTTYSSTLEEAKQSFSDAGIVVLESVSCEGFLSFMKPYINQLNLSDLEYNKLIKTATHANQDSLTHSSDHFLLIGQAQ